MDPTQPASRPSSPLRAELPRILVLLGIAFMILGAIATIGFVAGDSSCNSGTMLNGSAPLAAGFCGHAHGLLTASFLVLVLGAVLLTFGTMIIPTLRERDARRDAVNQAEPNSGDPVAE